MGAAAIGTTSKQLIAYSEHVKKRWIFHVGASMNILLGPVVDASAYAFAPQVVIAPFACLDVLFNAFTAPYTLSWQQERLTRVHVLGTAMVSVGACFTSIFGSFSDRIFTVSELEDQLLQPAALCYYAVELAWISSMHVCLEAKVLSPQCRGISLAVIAGVLMGNVFCTKGFIGIVRTTMSTGDPAPWMRPTPYILIAVAAGGAIVGHIFMRRGLSEYKGVFMVTIFEGAHITAACLSGCVVMQELAHAPWWQYVLYWVSVLTIVAGMLVINTAAVDATLAGTGAHVAPSPAVLGKGEIPTPLEVEPCLDDSHMDKFTSDAVAMLDTSRRRTPNERKSLRGRSLSESRRKLGLGDGGSGSVETEMRDATRVASPERRVQEAGSNGCSDDGFSRLALEV